jgi:ABC-type branched-subunit amino acid transport system ATPase component
VVLIDGKDMASDVAANHRPTNMVFQSYAIFPHLTVAENVGFGLRRDPRSKAEKAAGGRGAGDGRPERLWRARPMRCRAASGSGWRWRGR